MKDNESNGALAAQEDELREENELRENPVARVKRGKKNGLARLGKVRLQRLLENAGLDATPAFEELVAGILACWGFDSELCGRHILIPQREVEELREVLADLADLIAAHGRRRNPDEDYDAEEGEVDSD